MHKITAHLSADITYGIKITDERYCLLKRNHHRTLWTKALSGNNVAKKRFIYGIQINVEGLSPLSTDSLDTSRNGIARGYLAVG